MNAIMAGWSVKDYSCFDTLGCRFIFLLSTRDFVKTWALKTRWLSDTKGCCKLQKCQDSGTSEDTFDEELQARIKETEELAFHDEVIASVLLVSVQEEAKELKQQLQEAQQELNNANSQWGSLSSTGCKMTQKIWGKKYSIQSRLALRAVSTCNADSVQGCRLVAPV